MSGSPDRQRAYRERNRDVINARKRERIRNRQLQEPTEQALARGHSTLRIMRDLEVTYEYVKRVRDRLEAVNAA